MRMVRSSRHVAICSSASPCSSVKSWRLSSEHHSGAANEVLALSVAAIHAPALPFARSLRAGADSLICGIALVTALKLRGPLPSAATEGAGLYFISGGGSAFGLLASQASQSSLYQALVLAPK